MKIGSIVECVDDSNFNTKGEVKLPVKGFLYTVIGMKECYKGIGIYIEESKDYIVVNYGSFQREEMPPFNIKRFKEVLPPIEIEIKEEICDVIL